MLLFTPFHNLRMTFADYQQQVRRRESQKKSLSPLKSLTAHVIFYATQPRPLRGTYSVNRLSHQVYEPYWLLCGLTYP